MIVGKLFIKGQFTKSFMAIKKYLGIISKEINYLSHKIRSDLLASQKVY